MSDLGKNLMNPIITGRPDSVPVRSAPSKKDTVANRSFGEILQESLDKSKGITFSRHAQVRTEQRGIQLSDADLMRLNQAVGKAGDKGLKDTLVLMDNTAFIVNVPSRVVVTVVDGNETESNVFTNIDGAVIV